MREIVRSASYLTTQPRPLSPLQWSDLSIFHLISRNSLVVFFFFFFFFFHLAAPPPPLPSTPIPFHWVSNSPGIFQPARTQYLLTGWEFLSIFQPSPTQCLDREWVYPG